MYLYPMNLELKTFGAEPYGRVLFARSQLDRSQLMVTWDPMGPVLDVFLGEPGSKRGCLAVRQASQCQCLSTEAPCCWSKGRKHWPLGWNCAFPLLVHPFPKYSPKTSAAYAVTEARKESTVTALQSQQQALEAIVSQQQSQSLGQTELQSELRRVDPWQQEQMGGRIWQS